MNFLLVYNSTFYLSESVILHSLHWSKVSIVVPDSTTMYSAYFVCSLNLLACGVTGTADGAR